MISHQAGCTYLYWGRDRCGVRLWSPFYITIMEVLSNCVHFSDCSLMFLSANSIPRANILVATGDRFRTYVDPRDAGSFIVLRNTSVTLNCTASGDGVFSYSWSRVVGNTLESLPMENTSLYSVPPLQSDQMYECRVWNSLITTREQRSKATFSLRVVGKFSQFYKYGFPGLTLYLAKNASYCCLSINCSKFSHSPHSFLHLFCDGLKGSVERLRHERHLCLLLPYFFSFLTSNFPTFVCPSELRPFIWFFLKNSSRKKKNIRKTTQNALAPSIFIVFSIMLKLGTPLLHTQAQNMLLQNF